jgi:hypothetical protein
MASKTTDAVKLVVRLPKPLHKRLKQQARRRDVSLNTLIVSQLEGRDADAAEQIGLIVKRAIREEWTLLSDLGRRPLDKPEPDEAAPPDKKQVA